MGVGAAGALCHCAQNFQPSLTPKISVLPDDINESSREIGTLLSPLSQHLVDPLPENCIRGDNEEHAWGLLPPLINCSVVSIPPPVQTPSICREREYPISPQKLTCNEQSV